MPSSSILSLKASQSANANSLLLGFLKIAAGWYVPIKEYRFIYKLTVLLCHLKVFINKLLRRNSADAHYDFRLDNFKLLSKPIYAHILLFRFWVTVFRRAAFNHICNIYIFITRQVNACKEFIEQLTASTNKRLPLQILVSPGPSPISIISASFLPIPNTRFVLPSHKSHFVQFLHFISSSSNVIFHHQRYYIKFMVEIQSK